VCRGVMRAGRRAARVIDLELDRIADMERPLLDHALVQEETVQLFLRVADKEDGALAFGEPAAVADLAAGFGVERSLIDDDGAALAFLQRLDPRAVLDQGDDLAGGRFRLITQELG